MKPLFDNLGASFAGWSKTRLNNTLSHFDKAEEALVEFDEFEIKLAEFVYVENGPSKSRFRKLCGCLVFAAIMFVGWRASGSPTVGLIVGLLAATLLVRLLVHLHRRRTRASLDWLTINAASIPGTASPAVSRFSQ